ncbi:MAG: GvpL/GvpF family gas vesicle protein [Candidatus Korobacteraceae bacterium]
MESLKAGLRARTTRASKKGKALDGAPKKAGHPDAGRALYLYAISRMPKVAAGPVAAEGIDGKSNLEALRCEEYVCWISRVSKDEFADHLAENMQDLEWLASASLRHQRAVAEISQQSASLPARFGTVFLTEDSLRQHVKGRSTILRQALERVADADEWGIKLFEIAKPKPPATVQAASGSEYLKKKAEMLQPRTNKKLDEAGQTFVAAVTRLAVAASPGGKASAGQPGLMWHGSFLVRRKDRKKLDALLKKFAMQWHDHRRIDCSGPWPPYSFVEEHVS